MDCILIFGGRGYIAGKFKEKLPDVHLAGDDITNRADVGRTIDFYEADVVINCAGKTGRPNIDWCETHQSEAWRSNVLGPLTLAQVCLEKKVYFANMGSGCIYEGDNNGKGYSEDDPPNFIGSYYSRTKIAVEHALALLPVLQFRIRMPIDNKPGPRNLITKITNYSRVISVPNSVTVLDDFITAAHHLITCRATGIYNIVNPGVITHQEILELYKEIVDPSFKYALFSLDELYQITAAKRSNCVLSTQKLTVAGITLPDIHTALCDVLTKYKAATPAQTKRS